MNNRKRGNKVADNETLDLVTILKLWNAGASITQLADYYSRTRSAIQYAIGRAEAIGLGTARHPRRKPLEKLSAPLITLMLRS